MSDSTAAAIDSFNSQIMQLGANLQNQRNWEKAQRYQKDILRSQMLFQNHQYQQSYVDNSVANLAQQYADAGFNPRDAVNRPATANPMSAPSGMSAPPAPQFDLSPVVADMQRRHDSRLDDVERALSASKLLTDVKQRDVLTNQASKILSDILNDKTSLRLADAQQRFQIASFYETLELKRQDLQKRYDHLSEVLKETHNHNVIQEQSDLSFMLQNISSIVDLIKESLGFSADSWIGKAGKVINDFSNKVSGRPLWK